MTNITDQPQIIAREALRTCSVTLSASGHSMMDSRDDQRYHVVDKSSSIQANLLLVCSYLSSGSCSAFTFPFCFLCAIVCAALCANHMAASNPQPLLGCNSRRFRSCTSYKRTRSATRQLNIINRCTFFFGKASWLF